LRTTIYYALLPFRVAPFSCCALLKPLKQTPRYCSLLKPSVGLGRQKFSGYKSWGHKSLADTKVAFLNITSGVPMAAPLKATYLSFFKAIQANNKLAQHLLGVSFYFDVI